MQSPAKTSSSTSVNFHIPILPLIVDKIIFTIPTNTPFLFTSAISHYLIFTHNYPNKLRQKYFPYLNDFANTDQETRNQKARKPFEDFSHALKLLSFLPYPNNTTSKTLIPLESSCLTWYYF